MSADAGRPPAEYQSGAEIEEYLDGMRARDAGWEMGAFLRESQGLFVDITRNWSELDADASRPWMLDELWDAHREGIDAMRNEDLHPVLEHLAVQDVRITGAWLEDAWDCLLVRFTARSTDFKVNRLGRKIGDKSERTWLEEWTIAKEESDLTPASVPPGAPCPNCGGPGEGEIRCRFCHQLRTEGRGFRDVWKAASIEELQERP
jgi:predicted lipid-binding transport protein (Tim44 family)